MYSALSNKNLTCDDKIDCNGQGTCQYAITTFDNGNLTKPYNKTQKYCSCKFDFAGVNCNWPLNHYTNITKKVLESLNFLSALPEDQTNPGISLSLLSKISVFKDSLANNMDLFLSLFDKYY